MNQRLFLKVCSGICAALITGSAWINLLNKFWKLEIIVYSELPESIKSLYHRDFSRAFPDLSLGGILTELIHREIYISGVFHTGQIHYNATHEPLVEFENFLYTESELLLYAIVARLALLHVGITVLHAENIFHE